MKTSVLAVLCLLLCSCKAELVFVRGKDSENPQIFLMKADGSDQLNISQTAYDSSFPDVSSDGRTIAFRSHNTAAAGSVNVYLMPVDGGTRTQITSGAFQKSAPRWGLDSYASNIVVSSIRADGTRDLQIVSTSGALRTLTSPGPTFSDDFADIYYSTAESKFKVIFSRRHVASGNRDLMTVDADVAGAAQIVPDTPKNRNKDMPVVSHDGRFVAYRAVSLPSMPWAEEVRIMSVDTWEPVSTVTLAFPDQINIRGIGWSRSNKRLYVSMETSGVTGVTYTEDRSEIFSMKLDGTDQKRLTTNLEPDYWPNGVPCIFWLRWWCGLMDRFSGD